MKIMMRARPFAPEKYEGWHVLSPAQEETGADTEGQSVTVALPGWIATDHAFARTPEAIVEFRRVLEEFAETNRETFRSRRIVNNLYEAPRPLPFAYVKAIQDVFHNGASKSVVDQVEIYTTLLA